MNKLYLGLATVMAVAACGGSVVDEGTGGVTGTSTTGAGASTTGASTTGVSTTGTGTFTTGSGGGTSTGPDSGPKDNRELEARPDVLTFSTEPLGAPVEIIGPVQAELYVTSSLAHTDFFARLCDVDPKGRSTNVTDGILRLTEDAWPSGPVLVDLWPTAHQFQAGHRIRLQVSSGAHPRFARNPGTGERLATATSLKVAEQTVYPDPDHPSATLLPVVSP